MTKHSCMKIARGISVALAVLAVLRPPSPAQNTGTYLLGPADQVTVQALHVEDITNKPLRVDSSGYITLPLAGRVKAAGLTVEELQTEIAARLRPFIREPEVTVTVEESRSQPVSVVGAVNSPGVYQLQGRKTLIELLSMAGGAKPDAADTVRITRRVACAPLALASVRRDATNQFLVGEVSLRKLLEAKNPEENLTMCPEDVITLPRAALVYVMGEVRKPGGFPLRDQEQVSVLEAISMSEGLLRTAAPTRARILRPTADGSRRTEMPVNLKTILSGKAADVPMQPNDILVIPNSAYKSVVLRGAEAALQMGTGVVIWGR